MWTAQRWIRLQEEFAAKYKRFGKDYEIGFVSGEQLGFKTIERITISEAYLDFEPVTTLQCKTPSDGKLLVIMSNPTSPNTSPVNSHIAICANPLWQKVLEN